MASLNVEIKNEVVEVEYEGKTYKLTEEKAREGDLVRFYRRPYSFITRNGFYLVSRLNSHGDAQIIDDDGDEFDMCGEEFEVYAPLEEPKKEATIEYEEVTRHAKVGELIRITSKMDHRYENGDEFVVHEEAGGGGDVIVFDDNGERTCVLRFEYVVLVPKKQSPKLVEVHRPAIKGERIRIVSTFDYRWKNGDEFIVDHRRHYGVGIAHDNGTLDGGYAFVADSEYNVLVGEEESDKETKPKFEVGDKVRLISGGGQPGLFDYPNGGIYTIKDLGNSWTEKIQLTGGGQLHGYATPDQLEKVNEEEYEESRWQKSGRKPNEYKVGDVVVITKDQYGAEVGSLVRVNKITDTGVKYTYKKNHNYLASRGSIKLVCPVEYCNLINEGSE